MSDAYNFTSFHDAVEELPDGHNLAATILEGWIVAFRAKNFDDENPFGRKVHPAIQNEFDAIKVNAQAKTTVFDACEFIVKNNGCGTRQQLAMKAATAADFETVIKTIDIKGLRLFMRRMLEMTMQSGNYQPHFGHATDRFAEACKNIVQDPASGRLGKLIKNLFADSKVSHLVEQTAPCAVDAACPAVLTSDKLIGDQ